MSTLTQTRRADTKPASPKRKPQPVRKPAVARRPAYLQTKLAVSEPGDAQEQEADRIAKQVARSPRRAARAGLAPGGAGPESEQGLAPARLARQAGPEGETAETRLARSLARETEPEEDTAQAKLARAPARQAEPGEGTAQTRLALARQAEPEEDAVQTKLARALDRQAETEAEEETAQTQLARALARQAEAEEETAQMQPEQPEVAGTEVAPQTEQRIDNLRGMGAPLPEDVRADMEARLGRDLSDVRIHTSAEAAELCAEVNARAFTVGSDVFFAPGEFAPETEQGRELLAHELTHVRQQGGGAARKLMRADDDGNAGSDSSGRFGEKKRGYIEFPHLAVPSEIVSDYNAKAPFILHKSYSRARNDQTRVWREGIGVNTTKDKLAAIASRKLGAGSQPSRWMFEVPSQYAAPRPTEPAARNTEFLIGSSAVDCARQAAIPRWDHDGAPHASTSSRGGRQGSYDVDHIVEQRFGATGPTGDFSLRDDIHAMGNFFLLDGNINRNIKVNKLNTAIDDALDRFREGNDETYDGKAYSEWTNNGLLGRLSMKYLAAQSGEAIGASGNNVWTKGDIEGGAHIDALNPDGGNSAKIFFRTVADLEQQVPEGRVLIFYSPAGGKKKQINPEASGTYQDLLKPFKLAKIDNAAPDDLVRFSVSVPPQAPGLAPKTLDEPIAIKALDGSTRVGTLPTARFPLIMGLHQAADEQADTVLEHKDLSPISVDHWEVDPERGMVVQGRILPSITLLQGSGIDFELAGNDLTFSKTFSIDDIDVPAPFEVDTCELTIAAGTRGLDVSGEIAFAIERLGEGSAEAGYHSRDGLSLSGDFQFDERLFGRGTNAKIDFDYAAGAWSIGGTVTVPRGKVAGIDNATIEARYAEGEGFSASGEAELDIPGVDRGTLSVTHSEEEGLSIGGGFDLSADTPGIRSGHIEAELSERGDGDGYSLSASGEAEPDIPGFDSTLSVCYADGAITAEASARYQRGMLDGSIRAGATNRTLDDDGNPTGEPGEEIIVYGGGDVTIQIAPWLEGTAGIAFAPDGEVTVTGEIGLPDQIELFPRKEIDKSIFNISVQAPIVPGIVAEVGGGLSAQAGIGPGVIDELRLGITYNPAHEEDTHVTGAAHLEVPADAGLRLSVRAGIGLGITGASATGGLEVGGTLGIEGAAEAGVHIDWMPSQGLELNADVAVHAQPSFTFDISGYVAVTALGFSVYDQRWELASFSYGSDYRFGIRLPVNYTEGEPFDISLSDVEFEVPDIDTDRLLKGLIDRIG